MRRVGPDVDPRRNPGPVRLAQLPVVQSVEVDSVRVDARGQMPVADARQFQFVGR